MVLYRLCRNGSANIMPWGGFGLVRVGLGLFWLVWGGLVRLWWFGRVWRGLGWLGVGFGWFGVVLVGLGLFGMV